MSRWTHTDNDGTRTVFEAEEGEVEAILARQEAEDNEGEEDEVAFKKAIRIANSITARDPFAEEQHAAAIEVAEAALDSIQRRKRREAANLARREREECERNDSIQREAQAQREQERRDQQQREIDARRAQRAAAPIPVERATRPAKPLNREPEPLATRVREATASDPAERAAAARLANAQAAKIEAEAALLQAQAKAALESRPAAPATGAAAQRRARAASSSTAASSQRATQLHSAPGPSPRAEHDGAEGYGEADRLALGSVGHWPPTPAANRGAFWEKYDDWPRDWTLTGGDLGRFRGEVNLTRAVFAAQLGVPSALVKDAEMSPGERVGPALQIKLRRAMDQAAEERRRRREERAARADNASKPVLSVEALDGVAATQTAPTTPAPAPTAGTPVFTGADLAQLRAERRLTQKEMADLLGVEQGTISKGEGKAGAALGPALQEAMARLGAGGTADGAPAAPE